MKIYWAILLFLSISFAAEAQKIYVIGKVLDDKTKQPLDLASVRNLRTQAGTKTNKKGDFFLMTFIMDSVEISSLGYKSARFAFNKVVKDSTFYLRQEAVQLQEVIIYGKNDQKFQRELDELLAEPERLKKFTMNDAGDYAGISGGSLSLSPISMLYEAFGKDGKARRRLAFDMQQDRRIYYATFRFNRIASFSTKLTGEKLEEFRDYCRFNTDYILTATDYDLTYKILRFWDEFQKEGR